MTDNTNPFCFADHMLNVAAGCVVDSCAYKKWEQRLNMMKIKSLGKAFREGWLHNLMARVTPMTTRNSDDYLMMADLFITDASQASELLQKMSCDMSSFATAAGLYFSPSHTPPEMVMHKTIYMDISNLMADKFQLTDTPAPFACTTVQASDADSQQFIRTFVAKTFEQPAARVSAEDYLD